MIYQYKCKFYLNASHYIEINGKKGQAHSHCFEIVIDIGTKSQEQFIQFDEIERKINSVLNQYQDKLINDVAPFDKLNPTVENMCEYFKSIFLITILELNWILLTIEISETPSRSYIQNVVEDSYFNLLKGGEEEQKQTEGEQKQTEEEQKRAEEERRRDIEERIRLAIEAEKVQLEQEEKAIEAEKQQLEQRILNMKQQRENMEQNVRNRVLSLLQEGTAEKEKGEVKDIGVEIVQEQEGALLEQEESIEMFRGVDIREEYKREKEHNKRNSSLIDYEDDFDIDVNESMMHYDI